MKTQSESPAALLSLFMVLLLDVMGVVLVMPVLTPLILQPDSATLLPLSTPVLLRDLCYGIVLALFPLMMFFSAPILGDLSDHFGRKKILLACLIGVALSYLMAGFAIFEGSLSWLMVSRAFAGLAAGTQPIACAGIIDLSPGEAKIKNMSWIVFTQSLGVIIGPLIGAVTTQKHVVSWFSYSTPFFMAAGLSLANAIILCFSYRESFIPKVATAIQWSKGFSMFMAAFLEKRFRALSLASISFILAWGLYFQAVGWFFMERFQYGAGKIGLFTGFIGLIYAVNTSFLSKRLLKLFSNDTQAFLVFMGLMIFALFACVFTQSEWGQWFWVIIIATSVVNGYTIMMNLFSNSAGKDAQGWVMGVVSSLSAMAWGVGALISGPLGFMDIRVPLVMAGVFTVMSFVFGLIFKRAHHRSD